MCTLIALRAPEAAFPVVVASNRDERLDRPTRPFDRHWPGEPLRAGLDVSAGGTWAALHDDGLGVFVLNGPRALGPAPGRRSRGQLVLDLARQGTLARAATLLAGVSPDDYRPFHVVLASAEGVVAASVGVDDEVTGEGAEAVVPSRAGASSIDARAIDESLMIWTASGANTGASRRQVVHRPRFERLGTEYQTSGEVDALLDGLEEAMSAPAPGDEPWYAAMRVHSAEHTFGTRSSLLVAFGAEGALRVRVSDEPPGRGTFRDV